MNKNKLNSPHSITYTYQGVGKSFIKELPHSTIYNKNKKSSGNRFSLDFS
jgi:hypothetical protein